MEFQDGEDLNPVYSDELNHLLNFPSVARLFHDRENGDLERLVMRFEAIKHDLDAVIKRSTGEDARSAEKSLRAVTVALEFLKSLDTRQSSRDS